MEKVGSPANRTLPKVFVYLDDLHSAAEILKEEELYFGDISVALDSDSYRLKTLGSEEISELRTRIGKSRIHSLQITASPPKAARESDGPVGNPLNIVIDLAPNHASLTSTKDTVQGLGLLDKLEEHFKRCKRNESLTWIIPFLVYVIFLIFSSRGSGFGYLDTHLGSWAGFVIGLLPLVGFVAAALISKLIPHSTVILAKKVDAPTWWQRKRDDLLMEVVKTLISGSVGAILGFVIGSNSKP